MTKDATHDVRQMYEAHPYPSPVAGDALIRDVANMVAFLFPPGYLKGKTILDAGCGTGHRLVGYAKRFPDSDFLAVDMTGASLDTARELARRHGVENVRFQQCNLLELDLGAQFDLIVSTGVVNCLADPERGLANLCRHLAPGGHIILWHYHALGEHGRMLERELLLTFWDRNTMSLGEGMDILQSLGISLATDRYASAYGAKDNAVMDGVSMNVDAYLHPIVYTYRFDEALDMMARAGLDWTAVHAVNLGNESRLIDLGEVSEKAMRMFCLKNEDLFKSPAVAERYRRLGNRDKLKVIELMTRPTGFSVIGGRKDSYCVFDKRIQAGRVEFNPAARS